MKKIIQLALILLFIGFGAAAIAQAPIPPPPPSGNGNTTNQTAGGGAPLGSGLSFLLAMASVHAGRKWMLHNSRQKV